MSEWAVLAGSAAVVALMTVIAFVLGFRARAQIDEHELSRLLSASEPGARIADVAIADDRRAALARLTDGKLVVAKGMGDRVTLRAYAPTAVRLNVQTGRVTAAFADLGFPTLHMKLNDPPRWLADLAAGGGGNA